MSIKNYLKVTHIYSTIKLPKTLAQLNIMQGIIIKIKTHYSIFHKSDDSKNLRIYDVFGHRSFSYIIIKQIQTFISLNFVNIREFSNIS